MNVKTQAIAAAAATLAVYGCFVDLAREEAVLRIFVDGANEAARELVVEVVDDPDLPPFTARFELNDAARDDGPPSFALPDVSVVTGQVLIRARTLNEVDALVDGPLEERIDLVAGTNGLLIDFLAPPAVLPPGDNDNSNNNNPGGNTNSNDNNTPTGPTQQVSSLTAVQQFSIEPVGAQWVAEVPIGASAWTSLLTTLEAGLGEPAASLRIQHVTVVSDPIGVEEAESFDDGWEGTITVRVRGGDVDSVAAAFDGQELTQARSASLDIDVLAWRDGLPADARVELSGAVPEEGPDLPLVIRAIVEVVASP